MPGVAARRRVQVWGVVFCILEPYHLVYYVGDQAKRSKPAGRISLIDCQQVLGAPDARNEDAAFLIVTLEATHTFSANNILVRAGTNMGHGLRSASPRAEGVVVACESNPSRADPAY